MLFFLYILVYIILAGLALAFWGYLIAGIFSTLSYINQQITLKLKNYLKQKKDNQAFIVNKDSCFCGNPASWGLKTNNNTTVTFCEPCLKKFKQVTLPKIKKPKIATEWICTLRFSLKDMIHVYIDKKQVDKS